MTECSVVFDADTDHSRIVAIRTGGANPPLFCFPGSGGNSYVFEDMAAALPSGQPVYAINMEWLCSAKRPFTIEQLAVLYIDLIRKIQQSGPYYFCGYSFGGLVAYEIAVRLTQLGSSANLVALLDVPNPALISDLSPSESEQFRRVYLRDRLQKYGRLLLRGDIKAFVERGVYLITSRARRVLAPWIKIGLRMVNIPMPARLRADDPCFLKAWRSYIPGRYASRLVCFRVQDRGPEYDHNPSMGWDAYAVGGVDVHVVPGRHTDMLRRPHVSAIAEGIMAYLDHGLNRRQEVESLATVSVHPFSAQPNELTKDLRR
jgi:thioesterase domain-containing protein